MKYEILRDYLSSNKSIENKHMPLKNLNFMLANGLL